MADYIIPTPRNPILGLLADAMMGGLAYMEDPRRTQQMRGVGGLLSETGIAQTMERLSYGEPLTTGKGMTTRLRPEAEAAFLTLGPEAVPIGRAATAAVRATKGLPVGASIRQVAPQEEALRLAQQRATLPVSKGGLGLPPNNTPMDRARAMGYTPAYHGTNDVIEVMDRSFAGAKTGNPTTGLGISVATNPREASRYTKDFGSGGSPNVMPLMVRQGEVYDMPYNELNNYAMKLLTGPEKTAQKRFLSAQREASSRAAQLQSEGYDTIRAFTGKGHEEVFVPDPSRIRSRFAAFDPTRRNEPNLLAGALPFTALLDEENRARLEEQLGGLLGR